MDSSQYGVSLAESLRKSKYNVSEDILDGSRHGFHLVDLDLPQPKLGQTANNTLAGAGLIYEAVKGTIKHKNLETWNSWFTTPQGNLSYTVEAKPAGRRIVFTADPENIKAILATQFASYGKGKPFHDEWKEFLGDSIFTTDSDQWHDSRQLIRPQFIKDRVSDLVVFEEHVQILMRRMKEEGRTWDGKEGKPFDISDMLFRYTLDAATHFLFGNSADSLEKPEQEFAHAFGEVQRWQNYFSRAGFVSPFPDTRVVDFANKCKTVQISRPKRAV